MGAEDRRRVRRAIDLAPADRRILAEVLGLGMFPDAVPKTMIGQSRRRRNQYWKAGPEWQSFPSPT